jgi:hypothetical protein
VFTAPLGQRFEGFDVVAVPLEPPALDALAHFIRQSFARDR